MEWEEVVRDPSLKDLPFKIETNEWGKIMMAPGSDLHGIYQTEIAGLLRTWRKKGGPQPNAPFKPPEVSGLPMSHGEAEHFSRNTEYATSNSPNPRKSSLK